MKLFAFSKDGMKNISITEIIKISVWIDKKVNHLVNTDSIEALVKEAELSGKASVYTCGQLKGEIDAFPNPLWIHGQESVVFISDEKGNKVWQKQTGEDSKFRFLAHSILNFDSDDYQDLDSLRNEILPYGFDFNYGLDGGIFNLKQV
tara:strand:+ start:124 stop:567 length:444 start_codon:yes stop_codon:yes gene_type:complete